MLPPRSTLGMSHAILRIDKFKSWSAISGSGAHTYRIIETKNADPAKAHLNRTGIGTKGDVLGDVKRRVSEVTAKPRSNAVLAIELLLTASPTWFVGKSDAEVNAWARANIDWLRDTFGKENVVHAVMHCDESTPHLVAYVVPEKAGRLNARAITGTPELLSCMQTSYADAMAKFGLERGLMGSQAKHQTVKDWYRNLDAAAVAGQKLMDAVEAPTPPPNLPFWTMPETRQKAMEEWQGVEKGKRKEIVREAARAALAATTAQEEAQSLKEENHKLTDELIDLRRKLTDAYDALGLSKEDIAALRRANTSLVASRLDYTGPIQPKENAIDLLKRVGGFDYAQAVAWLYAEFGSVITGAVVKTSVEQAAPARPLTRSENVIKRAIEVQTDALACERYRVTLVPPEPDKKPYLPGKPAGKNSEERFYSKSDLLDLIPWLRLKNNQGMNVFITPMDDDAFYILLDDARVTAEELEARGFRPCLVQATSWEKTQMVFKVPRTLDRDAVLAVFNEMNQNMGDVEMTGLRHPFRLAGFRNMWPKHLRDGQRPFVQVMSAVNQMCSKCVHMVQKVMRSKVMHISTGPSTKNEFTFDR